MFFLCMLNCGICSLKNKYKIFDVFCFLIFFYGKKKAVTPVFKMVKYCSKVIILDLPQSEDFLIAAKLFTFYI